MSRLAILRVIPGCLIALLALVACRQADGKPKPGQKAERRVKKAGQQPCRAHSECASGVCSHYKADNGLCAKVGCKPGTHADNNHFFCNPKGKWEKSRRVGQACTKSFECFQPTCYMDPVCDTRPKLRALCEGGTCKQVVIKNACSAKGHKKLLAPEEYSLSADGRCIKSMAQRLLKTVCVPCGNGVCDKNESHCNCPADCN
jgi:hypothetical protein